MNRAISRNRSRAAVGVAVAGAVLGSALGGWSATGTFAAIAAAVMVGAVLVGRTTVVLAIGLGALTVAPHLQPEVGSVAGIALRVGDVLLLLAMLVAVVRGRPITWYPPLIWALTFVAWGVVRTVPLGTDASVSFARIAVPLVAGIVLGRLVAGGASPYLAFIGVAVAGLLTVPWLTPDGTRWQGLPGGPNEFGIVMAGVSLIAYTARARIPAWPVVSAIGAIATVFSRSISSVVALAVTFLVSRHRVGPASRLVPTVALALLAAPIVVAAVPVLREDVRNTLTVHAIQATAVVPTVASTNVVVGGGWTYSAAFTEQLPPLPIGYGLHNVFLQVLADLGAVGLVAFLALFASLASFRRWPTVAAISVATYLWFNTTGAFPSGAWSLLALALAATQAERPVSTPT